MLQTNRLQNTLRVVVATLSLLAAIDVTAADPISPHGRYFPYSQTTPPGVTAYSLQQLRSSECYYTQPIRIELPGSGSMGVFVPGSSAYGGAALQSLTLSANNAYQIAVGVGQTYRMRIADMQVNPGAELYPSIEVLDRLHPPAALKHDFPIPVVITEQEIEHALAGRLVTKVIYLEQPQLAAPRSFDETDTYRTVTLPNRTNLLAEADLRGRPLLILRLGSRRPAPNSNNAGFFGNGGPVEESFPSGRLAAGKTRLRFASGQRRAEISAR